MAYFEINGVLPPMITPFKENGDIDYDKHVFNIEKWNESDLRGYLVLGSNSETAYLMEEEKLRLVELTVKNAKSGKLILAGTGLESTSGTIELTNRVASLGVDAALILTPFYYANQMRDEALINYYSEIADSSSIPILIYNVPKFTNINISSNAVQVLSKHPNIIGMKDSSGNMAQMVSFINVCENDFNLVVGTASVWYTALALGVKAGILALANCCPNECIEIQNLFESGIMEKSKSIQKRVFEVNEAGTKIYGVAGLKYSCDLLGFKGGFTRSPLPQIKENEKNAIKDILIRAGVL